LNGKSSLHIRKCISLAMIVDFFWQKRHGWVTWNFSLVLNWNGLFPNGYGFVWVHGKWGLGGAKKIQKCVMFSSNQSYPYGVLAIVTLFIDRFSLVLRCLLTFKACCCCGEATLVCRLPRVTLEYPPPYVYTLCSWTASLAGSSNVAVNRTYTGLAAP
jgi:hypothetical protein